MMEIDLKKVSKHFGNVHALKDIDLRLEGGTILVMEGPNGSGKTTLLRVLATSLSADQGEYRWDRHLIHEVLSEARQGIGFLGEHPGLYEDLCAEENLDFWGRVYGIPEDTLSRRRDIALRLWELEHLRHRPVRTLSQGMRRRVGLAKLVLQNASLILLDEPFNGLDDQNTTVLLQALEQWKRDGKIMIVATHQPDILNSIATCRLHLEGGIGTPQELVSDTH